MNNINIKSVNAVRSKRNIIDIGQSRRNILAEIKKNKFIYLLLTPAVLLVLIFNYAPLYGIRIAFQNYNIYNPPLSEWIGLENFKGIFVSDKTLKAILNTFNISILNLLICFPASIVLALFLNEIKNGFFKRTVQTLSYLPHFLSWISVIGIATALYSKAGPINDLAVFFTGNDTRTLFLAKQEFFVPNVIMLNLWKGIGWGSIVYLAAISGVDTSLYEAAVLDGAGRLRQTMNITIPSIAPTIVIMLIWRTGSLFADNFELIYGLQNAFIDYEVIQTIIYKQGIAGGNYQMTTAFGLFQGVVNFSLLFIVNCFTKKTMEISIF